MNGDDILARTGEIGRLIHERLGLRGRTLGRQVRRAGRLLPRAVAREARYLAQAAEIAPNPRLWRMIDPGHVDRAHRIVRDHLLAVNPRDRRLTRILGVASVIAFNLIVVLALLLAVLVWRGYA